jgi:hypothetical protein
MSPRRSRARGRSAPHDRRTYALELEHAEPLRIGVGGVQFGGLTGALEEVVHVTGSGTLVTAQGDAGAILRWIGR